MLRSLHLIEVESIIAKKKKKCLEAHYSRLEVNTKVKRSYAVVLEAVEIQRPIKAGLDATFARGQMLTGQSNKDATPEAGATPEDLGHVPMVH